MKRFNSYLDERACDLVNMKQIKAFEKFVDNMFKRFNIDFNFTKHFGDRMGDDRNDPCISMKELADFIKKRNRRLLAENRTGAPPAVMRACASERSTHALISAA